MSRHITAIIVDDDTISINGQQLCGMGQVGDALAAARLQDPDLVVVIEAANPGHYKGIGTVIYASQRAGIAGDRVRYAAVEVDTSGRVAAPD